MFLKTPRIYVKNLPWTISHSQLEKYFSKFGEVTFCRVIFNYSSGLSRGYGYIEFKENQSLENILNTTHLLEGNKIITQIASN